MDIILKVSVINAGMSFEDDVSVVRLIVPDYTEKQDVENKIRKTNEMLQELNEN